MEQSLSKTWPIICACWKRSAWCGWRDERFSLCVLLLSQTLSQQSADYFLRLFISKNALQHSFELFFISCCALLLLPGLLCPIGQILWRWNLLLPSHCDLCWVHLGDIMFDGKQWVAIRS